MKEKYIYFNKWYGNRQQYSINIGIFPIPLIEKSYFTIYKQATSFDSYTDGDDRHHFPPDEAVKTTFRSGSRNLAGLIPHLHPPLFDNSIFVIQAKSSSAKYAGPTDVSSVRCRLCRQRTEETLSGAGSGYDES